MLQEKLRFGGQFENSKRWEHFLNFKRLFKCLINLLPCGPIWASPPISPLCSLSSSPKLPRAPCFLVTVGWFLIEPLPFPCLFLAQSFPLSFSIKALPPCGHHLHCFFLSFSMAAQHDPSHWWTSVEHTWENNSGDA